jgi:hypothetical protein
VRVFRPHQRRKAQDFGLFTVADEATDPRRPAIPGRPTPVRRAANPFAPSPPLQLLGDAAAALDDHSARALVTALAADYPRSLGRRPAQLLRTAGARPADLDRLLAAGGFAAFGDLRRQTVRRPNRRTSRPDTAAPASVAPSGPVPAPGATEPDPQLAAALAPAARAILRSRRRWVFADLRSRGYAQLFAAELGDALGQVQVIEPTSDAVLAAVRDAHRRDSLTVFSLRRHSRLTVRLAEQFAAAGATVVAVTDAEEGPLRSCAAHAVPVVAASPMDVTAVGHALAGHAAAGARAAARRVQDHDSLAAVLEWYEVADP